jgi:Delta7-sterol 5-desaturase
MERFLGMLAFDTGRYVITASIAFGVFWVWRWEALAHRHIQPRRPSRKAILREIKYSASTVFVFAGVGVLVLHLDRAGITRKYTQVSDHGVPYLVASVVIAIVLHDAYFYWTHRAMHHPVLYKYFHRVHHLSTNPSPWAAYAFSPLEALVSALVVPAILLVLPMHELAVFSFLGFMIVMNVLGHLGIELYPRWFARSRWTRWLSTTTHHNLHHRDFHGNYGLYFTWWDRWMGTQQTHYQDTFEEVTRPRPAA